MADDDDDQGAALDFFSKRKAPAQAPTLVPPPASSAPAITPLVEPVETAPTRARTGTAFMAGLSPSLLTSAAKSAVEKAEAASTEPPDSALDFFLRRRPTVPEPGMPEVSTHPPATPLPVLPVAAPVVDTVPEIEMPPSAPVRIEPGPEPRIEPRVEPRIEPRPEPAPAVQVREIADPYHEEETPRPKSKLPVVLGVVGLAAAAVAGFVLFGGDDSAPSDGAAGIVSAAAGTEATPKPTPGPAADAAAPAPRPGEPAAEGDPSENADEPEGAAEPEDAAEPESAAASGSKHKNSKGKKKSSGGSGGSSGKSAETLLADARKAAMGGNHSQAYDLAKQSYGKKKSDQALQLMGVSACNLASASKAKYVKNKLSGSKRDSIVKLCKAKGVSI